MLNPQDFNVFADTTLENIGKLYFTNLSLVDLQQLLQQMNPYCFIAKGMWAAFDIVKLLVDGELDRQEKQLIDQFLKDLAIYINSEVYTSNRPEIEGADLEFMRDGKIYDVFIADSQIEKNEKIEKENLLNIMQSPKNDSFIKRPIPVVGYFFGSTNQTSDESFLEIAGESFLNLSQVIPEHFLIL